MFLDNVNWKSYRNLPRWLKIGHLARVEQEKNDEDKLIFFFPRKVQWKHTKTRVLRGRGKEDKSPARGRKQSKISQIMKLFMVRKISPLQGDGNFENCLCLPGVSLRKEDKSPARGRKL